MRKISKSSSWSKTVVRKWLNIRRGAREFNSDSAATAVKPEGRRKSCSDGDFYVIVPDEFSEPWLMNPSNAYGPSKPLPVATYVNDSNFRMFVGTWNVGGRSPHERLNLRDWLRSPSPADIYVLGFQEIVPLNAGNVLGAEDNGPAAKWLSLIRQALNDQSQSKHDLAKDDYLDTNLKPRLSFSDLMSLEDELNFENSLSSNAKATEESPGSQPDRRPARKRYCLVASKQMVGIFLCVLVRADLQRQVSNLKVSCVGRGIMGYLGNKGSVSISMTVRNTSFCFVGTHLTSGEKEGDEVRRNFDVSEILKRTRFPRTCCTDSGPENILDHDKIVWLGDLNYRLRTRWSDVHELLQKHDWDALLEKDQLRIEQKAGRVFKGWEEGRIYFAPTYKYIANSDTYAVQASKSKEKRRTPAWCDRILWRGEGMNQMWYVRGESRFSDHRPVSSLFSVRVDDKPSHVVETRTLSCPAKMTVHPNTVLSTRVQAEELLTVARAQSCITAAPRYMIPSQS